MAPSLIDSRDFLERLLTECFGRITVDPAKGTGIPDKYFYSRIADRSKPPINQYCVDQLNRLFRFALSENSSYDRNEVAAKLAAVLGEASNMSLWGVAPTKEQAANGEVTLLDLLAILLRQSAGKNGFSSAKVKTLFSKAISGKDAKESAEEAMALAKNGVASFSISIAEADFSELIEDAKSVVDVCHFGGFSWTSFNRDALGMLLAKRDVRVRVALLDDDSRFFDYYSSFTGVSVEDLLNEVKEEISLWKTIFAEASARAEDHGTLFIYRHKGLPSKNLYRFDGRMVMSPLTSVRFGFSPPAVSFEQGVSSDMDYFSAYEQELDWLFSDGGELSWMSSAIHLLSPEEKELIFALLDCGELGIAELAKMFGMQATKVQKTLKKLENLGLIERKPSAKRALSKQGIEEVGALIEAVSI